MAVHPVRFSCAALAAAGLFAVASLSTGAPDRAATTTPPGTSMEKKPVSLATITRQEQALQFTSFDNDAALAIGNRIVEQAKADKVAVTVDVSVNRNPLFFHAMAGTSPNNADWIRRKSNLVNRTGHASFWVHTQAVERGQDFDNLPTFDSKDYAAHGGSFPIVVKGTGQIGTITVSGLAGVDDHAMVVRALKWYLKADDVPL
ncbi:heme-degrading domain-containing protein [Massilia luteola]|uniref:heme-degrading domain-containing protein n=1 Tax=Massilia luteola TaxID=3081751 RepID=UPI002ACC2E38|nr:heme-degrading domain-containing protein [Massilia sp. Gc5]